jgi:hypothetical protein
MGRRRSGGDIGRSKVVSAVEAMSNAAASEAGLLFNAGRGMRIMQVKI